MRAYYDAFSNNPAILPFAAQLYFMAEHWFNQSTHQGTFIDDSFARVAKDVQTNPTYRNYSQAPWYDYTMWFFRNTKNLAALGSRHLEDHIKPTYIEHLEQGIDAGLKTGMSCADASSRTIRELRSEHDLFLTTSVPYGIQQLKNKNILDSFPDSLGLGHVRFVQDNAVGMRFRATEETLRRYATKGLLPFKEIDRLKHESG